MKVVSQGQENCMSVRRKPRLETNNQTDQTETRKLRIYNILSYTESWNFEDVRCVHYSKYHLSEK